MAATTNSVQFLTPILSGHQRISLKVILFIPCFGTRVFVLNIVVCSYKLMTLKALRKELNNFTFPLSFLFKKIKTLTCYQVTRVESPFMMCS